jgi:DNA polymerase-3 subunit alpha
VSPDEDPGAAARRQRVEANFTPVGTDIRFGLTAIRNVGWNVVEQIISTRRELGRFTDFADFMDKVPAQVCNKRLIESLIKAGAYDEMKHGRRALLAVHEQAVDQYVDIKRNEAIGQDSLFGGSTTTRVASASACRARHREWDKQTLLGTSARCSASTSPTIR